MTIIKEKRTKLKLYFYNDYEKTLIHCNKCILKITCISNIKY